MTTEIRVHPLFLKLTGRRVLVVGAGEVAARKVAALVADGADVRVVAPEAHVDVQAMATTGTVRWERRTFEDADVDDAFLVFAATSNPDVQRAVAHAAEARHRFVVAIDDIANANAYSGAVLRKPPFTIAISSSGETPALTRLLREILEGALPGDDWIEHAKALRARWLAQGTPMGERFGQLVREFAAKRR